MRRLREDELTATQINLRIHESTMKKLKRVAVLLGYSKEEGAGHCRLAREILESFIEEKLLAGRGYSA